MCASTASRGQRRALTAPAAFVRIAPRLADAGFHVVAIDFPGHGMSDHRPLGSPHVTMTQYADAAYNALCELGWEQCTLVGHSMGGTSGCRGAARPC